LSKEIVLNFFHGTPFLGKNEVILWLRVVGILVCIHMPVEIEGLSQWKNTLLNVRGSRKKIVGYPPYLRIL